MDVIGKMSDRGKHIMLPEERRHELEDLMQGRHI